MTYTKKVIHSIGIVFLCNVLAAGIAYLTRIVLARTLTPAEYGLFSAVLTFTIFFLFFRDLGMGDALVRFIPQFQVEKKFDKIKTALVGTFAVQLLTSLILAVLFILFADVLASDYFKDAQAKPLVLIFVGYIMTSIFFTNLKSIFQGFQRMTIYPVVELAKNSTVLLLTLLFFSLGLGVRAPAWAYALASLILFVIFVPVALRTFSFYRYRITNVLAQTKELFFFGLPMIFTDIGGKLIGYTDTLMLTYYASLSEVGIYNVVLPTALMVVFLGKSTGSVVYPLVSELWAKKDLRRLTAGLVLWYKYAFVLLIPVIGILFLFSGVFLSLFFGPAYATGALALQILLVGTVFYLVASLNSHTLTAIGQAKRVTVIIFIAALLNVLLNAFLIPRYSIAGAAVATLVSYLFIFLASTWTIRKYLPLHPPLFQWGKILFSGALFLLLSYQLNLVIPLPPIFRALVAISSGLVMYIVLIFALGIIDMKEMKRYATLVLRREVPKDD